MEAQRQPLSLQRGEGHRSTLTVKHFDAII
jgi:hypothetical protein